MRTNNEIARRVLEEIWNEKKLELVDDLIAPQYVHHDPQAPIEPRGTDGYKGYIQYYLSAFPDLHFTIHDAVSEGDTVAQRWTVTGTHKAELGPIPPTGKRMSVTGMSIARFEEGKCVESWSNWDTLGLMQQLGVTRTEATGKAA
ncbi:MAG TPA: ester cyclase [Terriglobales bacterium]|nr:ester cyclase [Terriglobales bacterium]